MSDKDFFDLSKAEPFPWDRAAEKIDNETLSEFFRELYEANEQWIENELGAVQAALEACIKFARASGNDWRGRFTRPLAMLELELKNPAKRLPGNVLPAASGQKAERGRKAALLYLQAAAAFAVEQLGRPVKVSETKVAELLHDHLFPPGEFSERALQQKHGPTRRAKIAGLSSLVGTWRKEVKKSSPTASRAANCFKGLVAARPCDAATALAWLRGELEHAGFDSEDARAERLSRHEN